MSLQMSQTVLDIVSVLLYVVIIKITKQEVEAEQPHLMVEHRLMTTTYYPNLGRPVPMHKYQHPHWRPTSANLQRCAVVHVVLMHDTFVATRL